MKGMPHFAIKRASDIDDISPGSYARVSPRMARAILDYLGANPKLPRVEYCRDVAIAPGKVVQLIHYTRGYEFHRYH